MKTMLTIAGSDCSGGAGIQADIKTACAHGVYAMSAVTALTAQNTLGVQGIFPVSADFLGQQLDSVFSDIFPDSVKIGMTASEELIDVIYDRLLKYKPKQVVIDPVAISTSGQNLTVGSGIAVAKLFPLSTVITPNIPESELLWGMTVRNLEDVRSAAKELSQKYSCSVLIKGGHITGNPDDLLYRNGEITVFRGERINTGNSHGTGCTLSSAIAANLANGFSLIDSVRAAKEYVTRCLSANPDLGKGNGPLNHMIINFR